MSAARRFVPLEDLTKMSQKVSEHIDYEWHGWVVAGPLPAPPAEAQVRRDGGSTMRVPVIAPREALMALSPGPRTRPSLTTSSTSDEPFDVTLRVSERPDVVVLGLEMPYQGYGFCAGLGKSGRGVVRPDEPLRDRVVLDGWSTLPVLCHRAQNTCHAGNG